MISRRNFITAGVAALPALAGVPRWLHAADRAARIGADDAARMLQLSHTHTGERLAVEYFGAGHYHHEALSEVDRFLRDFRTGAVHRIDPSLLDILHQLRTATGATEPFEVISGYRSPRTNAMLRTRGGGGVASNSLHMQGKAIDIRLPGVSLKDLRDAALDLKRGGVGYYPASQFVHVDTGRVRRW